MMKYIFIRKWKHEYERKNVLESDIKILVPDCQAEIYFLKDRRKKILKMQLTVSLQITWRYKFITYKY